MLRAAVSAFLWMLAAATMTLAARFDRRPRPVQRFVLDGLTPITELPRERILVDPALWHDGLVAYATFHSAEGRA